MIDVVMLLLGIYYCNVTSFTRAHKNTRCWLWVGTPDLEYIK